MYLKQPDINIDIPEDYFSEAVLKKGFNLFRRNLIEQTGKDRQIYSFLVGNKHKKDVQLKLKKNIASDYVCSCNVFRCEHLLAAMLFLRKENYTLDQFDQTKLPDENERIYKAFEGKMEQHASSLNSFADLLEVTGNHKPSGKQVFLLLSAIVYCLRKNKERVLGISSEQLYSFFAEQKISKQHSDYLFFAVKESLKSQRKYESEVWYHLLPFLSPFLSRVMSEELKALFYSRKTNPVFPGNISNKEIALYLLTPAREKRTDEITAEYFISRALIFFAARRVNKGFLILDKGFELLRREKSVSLGAYIHFIIDYSIYYNQTDDQKKYLRELLIIEPFISSSMFDRVESLIQPGARKSFYNDIIAELFNKSSAEEKIFEIMYHQKQWNELLLFIRRRKLKFTSLNKVAVEMLPEISDVVLKIYPEFLVNGINSAGDGHYRNFIFDESRKFLMKINSDLREKLVEDVIAKLGGKHHLAEGFLKMLNPPA